MKDGYPEPYELKLIEKWDVSEFDGLINFIEERWEYKRFSRTTEGYLLRWKLSTSGWSGNEDIINALLNNFCFSMWHESWRRGGHYSFLIDPVNVGFYLVREYCETFKVSRQYIHQSKDKFDWYKLSKNKVFIKPKK